MVFTFTVKGGVTVNSAGKVQFREVLGCLTIAVIFTAENEVVGDDFSNTLHRMDLICEVCKVYENDVDILCPILKYTEAILCFSPNVQRSRTAVNSQHETETMLKARDAAADIPHDTRYTFTEEQNVMRRSWLKSLSNKIGAKDSDSFAALWRQFGDTTDVPAEVAQAAASAAAAQAVGNSKSRSFVEGGCVAPSREEEKKELKVS